MLAQAYQVRKKRTLKVIDEEGRDSPRQKLTNKFSFGGGGGGADETKAKCELPLVRQ